MDINPFQPGSGQMPPFLAGRDAVKKDINKLLVKHGLPRGVPRDIVLYGPRGTGKTVLLQWLADQCVDDPQDKTVLWVSPSPPMSLKDQLMEALDTPQAQVTTEGSGSLDAKVVKVGGKRSVVQSSQAEPLSSFLIKKAKENPLVLLVDEAHTIPANWGRELLNVSQVVRRHAPFLLVLAGAPELEDHLGTMDATFWSRSEIIPLGLLDATATAAAIEQPLAPSGITLTRDVLTHVVAESQHYPYFIQHWGDILWDTAKEAECRQIDQALLDEAWGAFNKKKDRLYKVYYAELKQKHMVPAALSIATAFKGREAISDIELHDTVAGKHVGIDPPDSVLETVRELKNLGYIWQGSEKSDWHPGIPSLMAHVVTEDQNLSPDNSGEFAPGM